MSNMCQLCQEFAQVANRVLQQQLLGKIDDDDYDRREQLAEQIADMAPETLAEVAAKAAAALAATGVNAEQLEALDELNGISGIILISLLRDLAALNVEGANA